MYAIRSYYVQDWQLNNGRIECIASGGDRNVYLLTHELIEKPGTLNMSVNFGQLDESESLDEGWIGFKIGIRGEFDDYRRITSYNVCYTKLLRKDESGNTIPSQRLASGELAFVEVKKRSTIEAAVITSYSIHYTKLYDQER